MNVKYFTERPVFNDNIFLTGAGVASEDVVKRRDCGLDSSTADEVEKVKYQ